MSVINEDRKRFQRLLDARHPCISISTVEETEALLELRELVINRKSCVLRGWSATKGVHNGLFDEKHPGTVEDTLNAARGLHHLANNREWDIAYILDIASHLRDEQTMRAMRDLIFDCCQNQRTIVLIDCSSELPHAVMSYATSFEFTLPNDGELEELIRTTLRSINREYKLHIELTKGNLRTIIKNLRGLNRRQARQIIRDVVWHDKQFNADDINHILAMKRQTLCSGGHLEYVETPVDLSSIGGLENLKRWLKMRKDSDHEEAEAFGLSSPRGVLMLGVQGAGKSMCAKAIATAWQRPLLRLDPPALYDRYIGESERRLRDALAQAEAMAPIVLWIDEIEKGFASASNASNDGGLSRRMFGTMLTWMQEHAHPVFLVATANDIEALPPELLRKGRFDEIFFVDLPKPSTRKEIFKIHLKLRKRDPKHFDIDTLVEASEGYSGAEIEQAIIAGLYEAYAEKKHLETKHVLHALVNSPPLSITMAERISALRQWSQSRCVPAES